MADGDQERMHACLGMTSLFSWGVVRRVLRSKILQLVLDTRSVHIVCRCAPLQGVTKHGPCLALQRLDTCPALGVVKHLEKVSDNEEYFLQKYVS